MRLYDRAMTRICPHCNVTARFTIRWSGEAHINEFDSLSRYIATCDNCEMPICAAYSSDATDDDDIQFWPATVIRATFPDVPEAIASVASEAHQALGAFAPRAAVATARAVIEATAKNKGITVYGIYNKIEQLRAGDYISEAMKLAAHEIRLAGNDAAHGDLTEETISVEEAAEIIDLMDTILERVYQEPAKVDHIRAAREARENRAQSTEGAEIP